ncbi:hypothetical protein [Nocardia farcinica]|nr:hypothetical protein [Nocardia farcinica]
MTRKVQLRSPGSATTGTGNGVAGGTNPSPPTPGGKATAPTTRPVALDL